MSSWSRAKPAALRATNFYRRANMPETLVVELKFGRPEQRLAQSMPLRLSRNSKYVIGVQSMASD